MKILITHGYSWRNSGDFAILLTLLGQIQRVFPGAATTVLMMDGIPKRLLPSYARVQNSLFHYSVNQNKHPIQRLSSKLAIFCLTLLWALWYKCFARNFFALVPSQVRATCKAYIEADLIIPIGGGYLNARNTLASDVTLFIQLHSLIVSKLLNKNIILYAQSIGPFSSRGQAFVVKSVLNLTDAIFSRERITVQTLKNIGVRKDLVHKAMDAAFSFTSEKQFNVRAMFPRQAVKKGKKVIGITVRQWLPQRQQARFELEIANFARHLIEKKNALVVFVPQVTTRFYNDDDRNVQNRIAKILGKNVSLLFLQKTYDAHTIKGIYNDLDYLIGTRMHSVIFALTGHVPSIAIAYEYKTRGVMRELGLSKYVISIEDVTCNKLIHLFEMLKRDKHTYRKTLIVSLRKSEKKLHSLEHKLTLLWRKAGVQ